MDQPVDNQSVTHHNPDEQSQPSFFKRKSNIIGIFALLITIAAIPLTVKLAQQRQTVRQQAAEDVACTHNKWNGIPDWLGGGNTLGNGYYCGPENPENHARCAAAGAYNNEGDTGAGIWLPGPVIPAGGTVGHGGQYPNWSNPYGGKIPVAYDSSKDKIRYEFSGHAGAESSWTRIIRWSDDVIAGNPDLSPEIVIKHMLARLKRDAIATDQWNGKEDNYGWDLRSIDATIYVNGTAGIDKMRTESLSCGGTIEPTSTQPVSCEEHLMSPPANFAVNLPNFSTNICAAASKDDPSTGHRVAEELFRCGDYWVTAWCNASNATQRQDVVYACRGWSQTGNGLPNGQDSFFRYFPNRIYTVTTSEGTNGPGGALLSNINRYGDLRGRRISWNSLMTEVKSGNIAFPYGYKDVDGALQAASMAIFGKAWGLVKNQERLNNCSTTWDGTLTPAPTFPPITGPVPSTAPSTAPSTGPSTGPTINPTGTNLNLTVVLHGIGVGADNATTDSSTSTKDAALLASRKQPPVTLIITDINDTESTKQEKRGTLTWNAATGKFTGVVDVSDLNLSTGNYTVKVKVDNFLVRRVSRSTVSITNGQTTNLPEVQLVAADANNDNKLTIEDWNLLRGCVTEGIDPPRACDAAKKVATDFNADGKVDSTDYLLFIRELSVQQGD